MRNPPDFVMYVVMVKVPGNKNFNPLWTMFENSDEDFAQGFRLRREALEEMRACQNIYGKKNAYVQQYGPIS